MEAPAPIDERTEELAMMRRPQNQPPAGGSLGEALKNLQKYVEQESFNNEQGQTQNLGPLQFDTKGVEFGPWIRRFVSQVRRNWFVPMAAMSLRGRVVLTFYVHRNGALTDVQVVQPSEIESFNTAAVNALLASNPTQPLPARVSGRQGVLHRHLLLQRVTAAVSDGGCLECRKCFGCRECIARCEAAARDARADRHRQERAGLALAEQLGGEIINCDSTAVYRGFDIGTDKVPAPSSSGIPHHLIDIVDPTDEYTAADYARDAAAIVRRSPRPRARADPRRRDGFLLSRADARAVSRSGQERRAARRGWSASRDRRGVEFLWRMVKRVDRRSAERILPRDRKRLDPRARGVFSDRAAADGALCRHGVAAGAGCRGDRPGAADAGGAGSPSDWRAASMRSSTPASSTKSAACSRAGVPRLHGRSAASCIGRCMDYLDGVRDLDATRASDRAREPPLRAPAVDLVSQRA